MSCKDDFNAKKRKNKKAPFRGIVLHHEKMRNSIESLFHDYGELVDLEGINRYGINMSRPAEFKWAKDGQHMYYFIDFAIIQLNQNQFKIIKHDTLF